MRVQRMTQTIIGQVAGQTRVRHLPQCVHTGVGASRAVHDHRLAGDGEKALFQTLLHRREAILALPAKVA